MMPNMLPRVGAGKKANVFYNTGHGHLGWTLSAITAQHLAGHVLAWSHVNLSLAGPTRLAQA
jgi:D-amino-acid dehydrogenase